MNPAVVEPVCADSNATPAAGRFSIIAFLPYAAIVALSLWFGGLAALILFVSTLFVKARVVAVDAAPVLFDAFEKYQLVLAAVALATLVFWRWAMPARLKTIALASTLIATGLAIVQIGLITPRIEKYRLADHTTFEKYHHLASTNYTTITAFVLSGLVLTTAAMRRETARV